jgi:integrase
MLIKHVRHLTARNVDTIKPTTKLVALRDSVEKGLELRIRPADKSGAKSWSVRYRIHGRQRRWKLGDYPKLSLADARDQARAKLRGVALGVDPHAQREAEARQREIDARRVTFGTLAQTYIETHARIRKRSWKVDRRYLEIECAEWKARLAAEITRRDVRQLIAAIKDRGAPIVANRVLEVVRSTFNFAIAQEIVDVNPAARCEKPGVERSRNRVLSDGEIRKFWTALDSQPAAMAAGFRLRLLTAQRGGEVFDMRWQDVDLESGWWTIPADRAKNGLAHRVPLSAPAVEIIKALCAEKGQTLDSEYVLAGARGRRQRGTASRANGIPDFVGHDLRRTAATRMGSLGVARFVIARILNHVDGGVTAVYDRATYDAEKRAALDVWATALDAILKVKEPADVESR